MDVPPHRRATPEDCVYQDDSGAWRWRLTARNNKIVAISGEAFTRRRDAVRSFRVAQRRFEPRPPDSWDDDELPPAA